MLTLKLITKFIQLIFVLVDGCFRAEKTETENIKTPFIKMY